MNDVIVDTCIWSLALRRQSKKTTEVTETLATLIYENRAVLVGPIRQEVQSGYSEPSRFEILKNKLSCFPDVELKSEDFIRAADFSNRCRRKGIQGSHIDFLICAVAFRTHNLIFTVDKDFQHYSNILPIKLY